MAETYWLSFSQHEMFGEEIEELQKQGEIPSSHYTPLLTAMDY